MKKIIKAEAKASLILFLIIKEIDQCVAYSKQLAKSNKANT